MQVSKYVIFATVLLLTLSSTSALVTATSPYLCGTTTLSTPLTCNVDTHGPRLTSVKFSVNPSVAPTQLIGANAIQDAEWTFTVAAYGSMPAGTAKGQTNTYVFYGIAFNTVRPYFNNLNLRLAIENLVDYSYIQVTVLSSGVAGTANPNIMPCYVYPSPACSSAGVPSPNPNLQLAWQELNMSGLDYSTNCAPSFLTSCMSSTVWTMGTSFHGFTYPVATGSYVNPGQCPGLGLPKCAFNPLFYYRSDSALRKNPAQNLCTVTAPKVGLSMDCVGIPGSSAGSLIYGAGESGNNDLAVNGSAPSTIPTNGWDMYTYGWQVSAVYNWPYYFFNSAFIGSSTNFINYNNAAMDTATNALIGATTAAGALSAAGTVAGLLATQIPYIDFEYTATLYAVEATGWTGYANEPSTGPGTGVGLAYTLMNVHSTASTFRGTSNVFNLALHSVADQSGLNPLYTTNWVWQADVWGSIYDTPFASPTKAVTTPNAYINWMTVGPVSYASLVHSFSGNTPTGAGTFDFLTPASNTVNNPITGHATAPETISGGQTISFVFRNNVTWSDNVPVTATDYMYSLFVWNLAGDSGVNTPLIDYMAGAGGLVAAKTYTVTSGTPNNVCTVASPCTGITMYIGSNSYWNLANVIVSVFPSHVFANLDTSKISVGTNALDLTLPYTSSDTDSAISLGAVVSNPGWMDWLPNLMVSSGPFYLFNYQEPPSGAGTMNANPNYMRTPWQVMAALTGNSHHKASSWTFTTGTTAGTSAIQEFTRTTNAGSSKATTFAPITSGTFKAYIYSKGVSGWGSTGSVLMRTITMTGGSGGHWNAAIASGLPVGTYEVVVKGTFTYQGLARTWFSFGGFTITT